MFACEALRVARGFGCSRHYGCMYRFMVTCNECTGDYCINEPHVIVKYTYKYL